ncbi:unnamed protein product [Closterium sp. NIES-53]
MRCPALPSRAATAATAATLATAPTSAMASPTVLTFDAEGSAVDFDVWVDDLQLFLQCDYSDGVSLFDHTFGVSTALAAIADSTVRSQWTTRDAVARLAVRSHLPPAERAHFGQYKTAQSLYDAVVARYSSPAIAALSRLMLPYLFPDLAAFATVSDLVAHLRTSDARYRAALPTEDQFLSLCPTELTVDLLEERLAAEKSILAVGASRGDRRTPFFEGCSPVPLLPSIASAAAVDLVGTEEVGAVSAPCGRNRNNRGKGSKGGGGGDGGSSGGGGGGGEVCGLPHTTQRCFGCLTDAWRAQLPDAVELPRRHDLLLQNVPIFDHDFDAILAAMYALADSAEGDCYLSVPPDPSIAAAALGASTSAALGASASAAPGAGASALSGTAPSESLHTFTLDYGASRSFFRDSTTLTLLRRPVAVSLADPSEGPVGPAVGTPPPLVLYELGSSLYTPTTAPPLGFASGQVAASSQVFAAASRSSPASAPCLCRPLFLPPLPPGPAPTCVPCVEGRQRAAPHSSSFLLTEAPLQTLHLDVWGPARVRGQGHVRYFLLVVDDYSRYTTIFPLRSKDRGGEFSSDLLRAFCRSEGIRQTFTLPASPQQNGIAERCIGMVMDVARTPMIHAAAPHFMCSTTPPRVMFCPLKMSRLTSRCRTTISFPTALPLPPPLPAALPGTRYSPGRPPPPPGAESGGALGVPSRWDPLSPQQLREWYSRHCRGAAAARGAARATGGAASAGGTAGASRGAAGAGAAGGAAGAGASGGTAGARAAGGAGGAAGGAARAGATSGAGGATGAGAARAAGGASRTGDPGAEGTGSVSAVSGGAARRRPYYVPLLQQLQPASALPGPSPYSGPTRGVTERREPESHPVSPESRSASPVRTVRAGRVSRPRLPPVPGTHSMTLRPSTAPQRVPLPSPPASSLPAGPDPAYDSLRAARPDVTRFLATAVTDPLFESTAASALVTELVDFAVACRLDYATSLVAESASAAVCPPSVEGECALCTDVLEDRQEEFECFAASVPHLVCMLLAPEGDPDAPDIPTPRSYAEAIEGPYSSQWQAAMDAEMAS